LSTSGISDGEIVVVATSEVEKEGIIDRCRVYGHDVKKWQKRQVMSSHSVDRGTTLFNNIIWTVCLLLIQFYSDLLSNLRNNGQIWLSITSQNLH